MYADQAGVLNELIRQCLAVFVITFSLFHWVLLKLNIFWCLTLGALSIVLVCGVSLPFFTPTNKKKIPSYRVSQIVHGSPTDVFRLIMNLDRVHLWDGAASSTRVVQTMDDHADILYVTQRPVYCWNMWQKARDLVLMRYWRREEDGSYFVMFQSTTHPECRVQHKYVRANLLGGGFVIAPQKSTATTDIKCLVTYVLRYDPAGYSKVLSHLGSGLDLVLPMLQNVVGIREEVAMNGFITPIVSVLSSEKDDPTATEGSMNKSENKVYISNGVLHGINRLPTNFPNKFWMEPDVSKFNVRGPQYLVNRKKFPSDSAPFHIVGCDFFSFENPAGRYHLGSRPEAVFHSSKAEFTFIINMIIPGPENLCLAFYFQPARPNLFDEDSAFSELLNDFLDGDDEFRNSRFKLIPSVVDGSFIIKQAVGAKPALIGNKLSCPYHKGDDYFEVDIDISSNSVANTVVGMVKGATKALVVDMAFLLEAQSEDELPEVVLGAIRLQNVSLDNPVRVAASSATPAATLESKKNI